jgi:hypothetical protein
MIHKMIHKGKNMPGLFKRAKGPIVIMPPPPIPPLFDAILKLLGRFHVIDYGVLDLARGQHEILVSANCNMHVWIHTENFGIGVCGGSNINKIGTESVEDGIIFYADINTDSCKITWFSTGLKRPHRKPRPEEPEVTEEEEEEE